MAGAVTRRAGRWRDTLAGVSPRVRRIERSLLCGALSLACTRTRPAVWTSATAQGARDAFVTAFVDAAVGDAPSDAPSVPSRVDAPVWLSMPTEVAQLATGGAEHACAVGRDGSVACAQSLLTTPAPRFSTVTGVRGALQVTLGEGRACAAQTDGRVMCWPLASDPEETSAAAPLVTSPQGLPPVAALDPSGRPCALTRSGEVWCWEAHAGGATALVARRVRSLAGVRTLVGGYAMDGRGEAWRISGRGLPTREEALRGATELTADVDGPLLHWRDARGALRVHVPYSVCEDEGAPRNVRRDTFGARSFPSPLEGSPRLQGVSVTRHGCARDGAVVCGVTAERGVRCAMSPEAGEALPGLSPVRLARLRSVAGVRLEGTVALWILGEDGRLARISLTDGE